ncbi:hypothetical protein VNI00_007341 [Paramarasmius palmivorus]|uniref:Uncharacterized protein n=1 Tax=Paramarasmius palmivorus TaxID=297713 RepID=A0AAW0D285_9AGAR
MATRYDAITSSTSIGQGPVFLHHVNYSTSPSPSPRLPLTARLLPNLFEGERSPPSSSSFSGTPGVTFPSEWSFDSNCKQSATPYSGDIIGGDIPLLSIQPGLTPIVPPNTPVTGETELAPTGWLMRGYYRDFFSFIEDKTVTVHPLDAFRATDRLFACLAHLMFVGIIPVGRELKKDLSIAFKGNLSSFLDLLERGYAKERRLEVVPVVNGEELRERFKHAFGACLHCGAYSGNYHEHRVELQGDKMVTKKLYSSTPSSQMDSFVDDSAFRSAWFGTDNYFSQESDSSTLVDDEQVDLSGSLYVDNLILD